MAAVLQFHNLARIDAMSDAAIDRDLPDDGPDEWTARELADRTLWHSKRLSAEAALFDQATGEQA